MQAKGIRAEAGNKKRRKRPTTAGNDEKNTRKGYNKKRTTEKEMKTPEKDKKGRTV